MNVGVFLKKKIWITKHCVLLEPLNYERILFKVLLSIVLCTLMLCSWLLYWIASYKQFCIVIVFTILFLFLLFYFCIITLLYSKCSLYRNDSYGHHLYCCCTLLHIGSKCMYSDVVIGQRLRFCQSSKS